MSCSSPVAVPEADEKTVAAGEEFMANAEPNALQPINLNENLSHDEVNKLAQEKVKEEFRALGDPSVLVCSRWKRLFGAIIDSVAGVVAVLLGVVLSLVMGAIGGPPEQGVNPAVMIVALILPGMLCLCQLYWIASEGRTIGKFCVKCKIVNLKGQPPGFFQGVLLRIFATALLGLVPFFSIVNILWIFGDAKRCLHDYIAGTYVIDA